MIPESELIINADKSIYHLNLRPHQIADCIITVGDPERVPKVSQFFDKIEFRIQKREFVTHTGYYKGKRLSVISTGMGTDNIEVLMTELDALVNIDFNTRQIKEKHTSLTLIRVGTSGAIQKDITIGSFLVSQNAIGLDTLMQFYPLAQNKEQTAITRKIQEKAKLGFTPYLASADTSLFGHFKDEMIAGNTLTCPGFYAPQGRKVRISPHTEDYVIKISNAVENFRLTNMEMETAGYYSMANLLGHKMLSLNAILANRITHQFSPQPEKVVMDLIQFTLGRVVDLP